MGLYADLGAPLASVVFAQDAEGANWWDHEGFGIVATQASTMATRRLFAVVQTRKKKESVQVSRPIRDPRGEKANAGRLSESDRVSRPIRWCELDYATLQTLTR